MTKDLHIITSTLKGEVTCLLPARRKAEEWLAVAPGTRVELPYSWSNLFGSSRSGTHCNLAYARKRHCLEQHTSGKSRHTLAQEIC